MATGDIKSVTVNTDGWSVQVVIEGWAGKAGTVTYNFGSLDSSPATTATPTMTFTIVSEGYNAIGVLGTVTRTVYGTHVVRKAYPNQASKDEADSGADLTIRVALSECIYNDDKNGGAGTSGTDPTVTISAAWATDGSSNTTAAATNLAVTNSSTLDYPKVIAQWAWGHTPAWRRVETTFVMGAIAYHGHGIACVALSATEGVNSVTGTATTKTKHLMSASGLYYESYDLSVPLTSMTQGNDITLKFVAYPTVGDADSIIDTSTNTTSTDDIRGLTQITCTCDKTGALKDYAVVSTAGNDTTGAKSTTLATAEGTPYLTIGKALASGATVIYCRTGTFDWLGSTPASVTQRNYAIEVLPYPSESVSLGRNGTWKTPKAKVIEYSGFAIDCASTTGYLDGNSVSGAKLIFRNNTFTQSAIPTVSNGYRWEGCWYINNALCNDFYRSFSTSRVAFSFTGNSCTEPFDTITATEKPIYGFVANNFTGGGGFLDKSATNPAPAPTNFIFANNKMMSCTVNTQKVFSMGATSTAGNDIAFIGNIIEVKTRTASQAALWMFADSSTGNLYNVILAHNTIAGERCNLFYNDSGTTANVRYNIFVRNNAFRSYNIKTDTFTVENANRVGNWAMVNGVNYSDNRYDGTESSLFTNDYDGINVSWVTAKNQTYAQMQYANEQSYDSGAAGNGNYTPAVGSPLKDQRLRVKYLSYDMAGNTV